MITIISPAKTMDFSSPIPELKSSRLKFSEHSNLLLNKLRTFSSGQLAKILKVSDIIANRNFDRFSDFDNLPQRQAIFAYNGDVYNNIPKTLLTEPELDFAQDRIRIISGFYGLLKPLDLIKAYRLEMSAKVPGITPSGMASFWQSIITEELNKELDKHSNKELINLASNEYSAAVIRSKLKAPIINVHFLEYHKGQIKNIAINSKKARGLMAYFIIKNSLDTSEDLKKFTEKGYRFDASKSTATDYYFIKLDNNTR